ncbi:MAG: phosphocholine cytidylyltransferase family protein [Alphaproteobacteria bacterium]
MKAIMLAAGVGRRLFGDDYAQPPKCLLEFGDKTLMQRHLENLQNLGVDAMTLVLGHRAGTILDAARKHAPDDFIAPVFNPYYRGGPLVSLWMAGDDLRAGEDILFMDADVLYHPDMLERLVESPHANCFLFDEKIDDGDEPVRLCLNDGVPVDFGKNIKGDFSAVGEWPGFLKLSAEMAAKVADALDVYIDQARMHMAYEPAMRDVLIAEPRGTFAIVDVSDMAWIEIDFTEDLERAEKEILPRLP